MTQPILHIISHTDLDGVAAAALAWHFAQGSGKLVKVSLTGYGDVDELIITSLRRGDEPLVLDLFCQREQTVDEIDKIWDDSRPPFLFDHHKSTFERYANRKWVCVDTGYCGALVYWRWLMAKNPSGRALEVLQRLEPLVRVANDRDLWLGEMPDSRLWQGLLSLCGHWSFFSRLAADPSAEMTNTERRGAEDYVERQEERFATARQFIVRSGDDLAFVRDGLLEFGDVSDFCGLILDRDPLAPRVAAVTAKRLGGDWAVSLRSRDGFAGRVMSLLKDGKKVRGGGHGDSSALYFPRAYTEEQIRESILAAIKVQKEREESPAVTLGDLFKARGLA